MGVWGNILPFWLPYCDDKFEVELAEITLCFYLVDALFFYADSCFSLFGA